MRTAQLGDYGTLEQSNSNSVHFNATGYGSLSNHLFLSPINSSHLFLNEMQDSYKPLLVDLTYYQNYSDWLAYVVGIAKYFDSNPRKKCSVQIGQIS